MPLQMDRRITKADGLLKPQVPPSTFEALWAPLNNRKDTKCRKVARGNERKAFSFPDEVLFNIVDFCRSDSLTPAMISCKAFYRVGISLFLCHVYYVNRSADQVFKKTATSHTIIPNVFWLLNWVFHGQLSDGIFLNYA